MAADRQREILLKTKMVLYLKPTAVSYGLLAIGISVYIWQY